jgi:tetratricopeptide (TPR) repeat protein
MTLPQIHDERIINLFNRANHFRKQNDFDKALSAYELILNDDNTNAEAHWGAVISKFGIEYVEDPRTHLPVPTCHRVQYDSILTDTDYLAALEHASDSYVRELYEAQAKEISEIQKRILAISSKEPPFDVFICYKESTEGGTRTKDSTIAQDIYYQLTKENYKVFFSKITLEDKLGQEYEPYIFSAINSAKVMLVIGTKTEYFNAVWVKNEWSRFLALAKKDRSRLLIPCYKDMDAYDLPEELSALQSQDMSKVGFLQDIIGGVRKVLEAAKPQTASAGSTAVFVTEEESLLRRALTFLEEKD